MFAAEITVHLSVQIPVGSVCASTCIYYLSTSVKTWEFFAGMFWIENAMHKLYS